MENFLITKNEYSDVIHKIYRFETNEGISLLEFKDGVGTKYNITFIKFDGIGDDYEITSDVSILTDDINFVEKLFLHRKASCEQYV